MRSRLGSDPKSHGVRSDQAEGIERPRKGRMRLSAHLIISTDVEHARGRLSVAVKAHAYDRCPVLGDEQGESGAAQVAAPIGGVVVPLAVRAAGWGGCQRGAVEDGDYQKHRDAGTVNGDEGR